MINSIVLYTNKTLNEDSETFVLIKIDFPFSLSLIIANHTIQKISIDSQSNSWSYWPPHNRQSSWKKSLACERRKRERKREGEGESEKQKETWKRVTAFHIKNENRIWHVLYSFIIIVIHRVYVFLQTSCSTLQFNAFSDAIAIFKTI